MTWHTQHHPHIEIMALEDGMCLLRGAAKLDRESSEAFEAVADLAAGSGCRTRPARKCPT